VNEISNVKIAKLRADQVKTKQGLAAAERELEQLELKAARVANAHLMQAGKSRIHRLIER
jgi:hypothetical protein